MVYEFYKDKERKHFLMKMVTKGNVEGIILQYTGEVIRKKEKNRDYLGEFYVFSEEDNVEKTPKLVHYYQSSKYDYRRVFSAILNSMYMIEQRDEIIELTVNELTYTNIKEVRFISNEISKVSFEAKVNDEEVTMCVPIPLESRQCNLSEYSQEYLYCLKDNKVELKYYGEYQVFHSNYSANLTFTIDLFYGKNENKRGIYFFFRNKITPMFEVEKKNSQCYLKWGNIRKLFWNMSEGKNVQSDFDEIENEVEYNMSSDLCNLDILEKQYFERFESEASAFIWNNIVYEDSIDINVKNEELIGEKQSNGTYRFLLNKENEIYYDATPSAISILQSDYYYSFNQPGRLYIGKLFKDLNAEENPLFMECIFKGNTVSVAVEKCNTLVGSKISLPPIQWTQNDLNKIGTVKDVKEYIDKNIEELIRLKNKLEGYSEDEEIVEYMVKGTVPSIALEVNSIKRVLYPTPMIANDEIVNIVFEARKKYQISDYKKIPNFVIMGAPGTGKSTLVYNIAECFLGVKFTKDKVLYKSTSDLKGAFVGHTGVRMFNLLVNAAEKEQIIFIDEAYNLQQDDFGREALELILPLLTGDRDVIESPATEEFEAREYSFKEHGKQVPPIWFAGYEHETRKMLSQNPGLYRRMTKITLPSPTVDGLYEYLIDKCEIDDAPYLKKCFEQNRKVIRNYFDWATASDYVNYFGNYAGVSDFFKTCEVRISEECNEDTNRGQIVSDIIAKIIDEKKKEIKRQFKAVLEDIEKIQFEIQSDIEVVLDDVKGNEKVVKDLQGIVDMMMQQDDYLKKGIHIPKGALLMGPPGTGKTMFARAVAGEVQKRCREKEKKDVKISFIATIATELNSPEMIKALFNQASEYDMSVIFIDEIDAIGKHRGKQVNADSTLLIQLMKELDGFEERKNIFVMAATNDPDSLDPALMRPGRFDRIIEVTYPSKEGRIDILKSAISKLQIFKGKEEEAEELIGKVAEKTIQYTPVELINLVNETAILYEESESNKGEVLHRKELQKDATPIERFAMDMNEKLERLSVGELNSVSKEESFDVMENKGCSAVAIHEVGHAMVNTLLHLDPFERITIYSRRDEIGLTMQKKQSELLTKNDYLNQIRVCLGGRVAEEIFYGDNISTKAAQDVQKATHYAEEMITLYGMSDAIGPMVLKAGATEYLGYTSEYTCSDRFRYEVDVAIKKLLLEQMEFTRDILKEHKESIKKMAHYLFHNELVSGEEFRNKYKEIIK